MLRGRAVVTLTRSIVSGKGRSVENRPCGLFRFLSSPPHLRRPPARQHDSNHANQTKWRTHNVNLVTGDYSGSSPEPGDADTKMSTYDWEEEELELSNEAKTMQQDIDIEKDRWIQNALPPSRQPVIDALGRAYGRGGRKTASARVWIQPGFGIVVVNNKDFVDYFERSSDREKILAPLAATSTCGKFDIVAAVSGGGLTGQAGAIRHGLARALNHFNPALYRPPLKRLGFLTRDPRKVERKKIGHVKARKKPQWVKR